MPTQKRRGPANKCVLQPFQLKEIRDKLNNEAYINEAIQRLALVLSNEIFDLSQREQNNGRK